MRGSGSGFQGEGWRHSNCLDFRPSQAHSQVKAPCSQASYSTPLIVISPPWRWEKDSRPWLAGCVHLTEAGVPSTWHRAEHMEALNKCQFGYYLKIPTSHYFQPQKLKQWFPHEKLAFISSFIRYIFVKHQLLRAQSRGYSYDNVATVPAPTLASWGAAVACPGLGWQGAGSPPGTQQPEPVCLG